MLAPQIRQSLRLKEKAAAADTASIKALVYRVEPTR
jgi:hypothetical protein